MSEQIKHLSGESLYQVTKDAKVVAIRWDLIPWSLVLDLDSRESEENTAQVYRTWVIFSGLSEIFWPFNFSRLPNGCWLTSPIEVSSSSDEFNLYQFRGLLPMFNGKQLLENVTKDISIRAMGINGVRSIKTSESKEFGLDYGERLELATDKVLLEGFINFTQQ